jgi:hypothetical protein
VEMVYPARTQNEIALAVRYDLNGNMTGANLLSVPEGAFTRRRGRVRPTAGLESLLVDPGIVWTPRRNLDTAGGTVPGTGTGGRSERVDAADWSGYGAAPFVPANPDLRRGQLQRVGMSEADAERVTRQPGPIRRLLGMN